MIQILRRFYCALTLHNYRPVLHNYPVTTSRCARCGEWKTETRKVWNCECLSEP